jgi:hypothetical protein
MLIEILAQSVPPVVPLLENATWTFGAAVALIFGTLFAWFLLAVFRRWAPLLLVAAGIAAAGWSCRDRLPGAWETAQSALLALGL